MDAITAGLERISAQYRQIVFAEVRNLFFHIEQQAFNESCWNVESAWTNLNQNLDFKWKEIYLVHIWRKICNLFSTSPQFADKMRTKNKNAHKTKTP